MSACRLPVGGYVPSHEKAWMQKYKICGREFCSTKVRSVAAEQNGNPNHAQLERYSWGANCGTCTARQGGFF